MSTQLSKEVLRFRAAERRTLRWLRRLVDWADDRLHAAEVRHREESHELNRSLPKPQSIGFEDQAGPNVRPAALSSSSGESAESGVDGTSRRADSFLTWQRIAKANRKGALPGKRKRRKTAAEFDQKYAGFAGVGLAR